MCEISSDSHLTHALLLNAGSPVAIGDIGNVITNENLSTAYGLAIDVQSQNGRYFARAR